MDDLDDGRNFKVMICYCFWGFESATSLIKDDAIKIIIHATTSKMR